MLKALLYHSERLYSVNYADQTGTNLAACDCENMFVAFGVISTAGGTPLASGVQQSHCTPTAYLNSLAVGSPFG